MGEKDFSKIPNGHPAIENRMELLYSEGVEKGRISLNKYVEVTSTNAAKIFGMFPQKGTIGIGADADIIIFDRKETQDLCKDTSHECGLFRLRRMGSYGKGRDCIAERESCD